MASLLKEGLNDCYHINFLAYDKDSGSAAAAPVLFFTEAVILSSDETNIRLCVPVDLVTDIGMPSTPSARTCETVKKNPIYDCITM